MITNLTIGRYGRFANQLFQIAAIIGIASKWGEDFAFMPWINYDHKERFGSNEDIDIQKYFVNPLPSLPDKHFQHGDFEELPVPWGYHDIQRPAYPHQNITGHFQSEKWFKHSIDEVRHYFKTPGEQLFKDAVAVHVRRGDYDDKYHTILRSDYYNKAFSMFPKDQLYFVFSDNIEAAKGIVGADRLNFCLFQGSNYIKDFILMKQCRNFICANSSYSLMAAILSEEPNKKIICPSNWFGPAWNPDTKDLYPEGAIVI